MHCTHTFDSSGCAIICLQETKRDHFKHSSIRKFCLRRFDKFSHFPSVGTSGGFLIIWNSSVFQGEVIGNVSWAITMKFHSTQTNITWFFANIYGPCLGDDRDNFVQRLHDLEIQKIGFWLEITIFTDHNLIE
jgi:hypothetical protein